MCSNSVFRLGFLEIKSIVIRVIRCFNTVRSDVTQFNPKKISFDIVFQHCTEINFNNYNYS